MFETIEQCILLQQVLTVLWDKWSKGFSYQNVCKKTCEHRMTTVVTLTKNTYTILPFHVSTKKNPFPRKNQTLRSYSVYILPIRQASSVLILIESITIEIVPFHCFLLLF